MTHGNDLSKYPNVSRDVVDFLQLDVRLDPDSLRTTKWEELRHDDRFIEVIHGAIVQSTELQPGITSSENFLKGVAFALKAVQDTLQANAVDEPLLQDNSPQGKG